MIVDQRSAMYPILNKEQQDFLDRHKIPLDEVYESTGLKGAKLTERMNSLGALFVFNSSPCKDKAHKFKTKCGHCIACNVAGIAILRRSTKSGFIYVLESQKINLVKIGVTQNAVAERVKQLKGMSYGSTNDWILRHSQAVNEMGSIEAAVARALDSYQVDKDYSRYSKVTYARELFNISAADAIKVVQDCSNC